MNGVGTKLANNLFYPSNLTFGSGGKDKDGNNVTGYGYYEVRAAVLPSVEVLTYTIYSLTK